MSGSLVKPAELQIKQVPDENPYELSPIALDELDMRIEPRFTRLPQDPPQAPARPRPSLAETNVSTGQPVSPNYKNPPPYGTRPAHENGHGHGHRHGHGHGHGHGGQHFYEEVNQAELSKKLNKEFEYGSPSSLPQSHTEADQAILFSQSSTTNSLAPLTDSVEKKPRKKVNPLYDSYRGEETLDSTGADTSIYATTDEVKKHRGPASHIGSILKHPCFIFLLMVFVVALVVVFVLLMQGTITSRGLSAGLTGPAPNSTTMEEEMALLRRQVSDQAELISTLTEKIVTLERAITTPGNENASVDLRVAQNSLKLMQLNETMNALSGEVHQIDIKADLAYQQTSIAISTNAALINRVTLLENQTMTLDGRVNSLNGNLQTHSTDIVSIKATNMQQDNTLQQVENQINVVQQEFESTLDEYNITIFEEMARISKMQGPRGYNGSDGAPGVGDLSRCVYDREAVGSGASAAVTETAVISAGSNEILTGVSCSTDGGERALLVREGSSPSYRFKCQCSGTYPGTATSRFCYMHYWKCPLT